MKTVICTALGLVLSAGLGYPQDPAGGSGDKKGDMASAEKRAGGEEELDKAAAKAGAMTNYSCAFAIKMEGTGAEGMQPVEIQIQDGLPWRLKSGEVEVYRKGESLAIKEGEGWKKLERGRLVEGQPPDARAMAAQALRLIRAPHEILKDLKTASFQEVKREDSGTERCFSGELTAEALRQLAPPRRAGERAQGPSTGTAKVWISPEGVVTKYEICVESKMKDRGDQDVTVKRTTTVEIRDIGSTKYDVPPEAAKALEG